ncbi:MAG: hypothetical protein IPK63_12890 [Candidatus Competibacteraceae bacterium]|nr:hypothetical protein [Candidatus Competibacteraceae bacterium]
MDEGATVVMPALGNHFIHLAMRPQDTFDVAPVSSGQLFRGRHLEFSGELEYLIEVPAAKSRRGCRQYQAW